MKINVVMPQLGESVAEGEVLRWLKRAGEAVRRDEALVEVKTDKATVEIPAPATGTLSEILAQEGEKVAVGAGIAALESTSEAAALAVEGTTTGARLVEPPVERLKSEERKPVPQPEPVVEKPLRKTPPRAPDARHPSAAEAALRPPSGGRARMTPLARRVAAELGADLSKITGSGEGGRITREDVLHAQAPREAEAPAAKQPAQPAKPASKAAPAGRAAETQAAQPQPEPVPAVGAEDEAVALSPVRRRIAARMVQSSQTIPQVTTAVEADMTPVAELRKRHGEAYEKAGVKLSYLPFIMKACVDGLKEFRAVNASWGGDKLILYRRVHLGMAVSVVRPGSGQAESALVVPVIRNADSMSVRQLAQRLAQVAEHARSGKLAADEVQGSTFTITNPGVFGTVFSTPLINPPEAAILAVCRIAEAPVVRDGEIGVRLMTRLCLSYDHRIVDGETAIQFLQHIRATLEAAKFEMG